MTQVAIEIGAAQSRIVGVLPPHAHETLRAHLSYKVQGAYFHPLFREGKWDGRRYLFTDKGQKFATGLLPRAVELLAHCGVEVQFFDKRSVPPPSQFMPIRQEFEDEFRPYQLDAIQKAIDEQGGILRIATGGGKTRIGAGIIARHERPALFLVHRRDLLHQAVDVLRHLMLYPELVGEVGDGVFNPAPITVATVQSLCAALNITVDKADDDLPDEDTDESIVDRKGAVLELLRASEVIVVDECHHVPAATIYDLLAKANGGAFRYGLSATDWRDDGADLQIEAALGARIVDINLSQLIDWGFLVAPEITMHKMRQNPEDYGGKEQWTGIYKHFVTNNESFADQVVDINAVWYAQGRTILTLVTTLAHGRYLERLHRQRGIPALFLSGKDDSTTRADALNRVRSRDLRCLIATSIADEGLDLPALDALNLAGGGKSTTRAYQRIGRILRPAPGKSSGLVADYMSAGHDWIDKHSKDRMKIYKAEPRFKVIIE